MRGQSQKTCHHVVRGLHSGVSAPCGRTLYSKTPDPGNAVSHPGVWAYSFIPLHKAKRRMAMWETIIVTHQGHIHHYQSFTDMKIFNKFLLPLLGAFVLTTACDDDDHASIPEINDEPSAIIVNQGSMGYLPGTLDLLTLTDDIYQAGVATIEGSPQNVVECGGYLFIPQFEKGQVAVLDKSSLRSVGAIAVPAPQSVCTDGTRVFAVGADSIFRLNVKSLAVEKKDTVGHTAFTSAYMGGNVYVAIGRGMGQYEGGTQLAKVNPETLQREYINVGINPYNQMVANEEDGLFVVCTGNYYDIPSAVYHVSADGIATKVCPGSYIDVCNGKLYVVTRTSSYDNDYNETSSCTYQTYSTSTRSLLSDDFLAPDAPHPAAATFVKVNPQGGEIFIGAAGLTESGFVSYVTPGDLYRFAADGKALSRHQAGVSPYSILFVNRRVMVK